MSICAHLKPLPKRLEDLPIWDGYPIPWLVEWATTDEQFDQVVPPKEGSGKLGALSVARRSDREKNRVLRCARAAICWVCGQQMSAERAFVVPKAAVETGKTNEPPGDSECVEWAVRHCPWLVAFSGVVAMVTTADASETLDQKDVVVWDISKPKAVTYWQHGHQVEGA